MSKKGLLIFFFTWYQFAELIFTWHELHKKLLIFIKMVVTKHRRKGKKRKKDTPKNGYIMPALSIAL